MYVFLFLFSYRRVRDCSRLRRRGIGDQIFNYQRIIGRYERIKLRHEEEKRREEYR